MNLDVYAYGIPGSGTLQQWLAYKRLRKNINPDILLIQSCTNDVFNDSLEFSYVTITRNQALRAPYLINDVISQRQGLYPTIYRFLINRSDLFYLLDYGLMALQSKNFNKWEILPEDIFKKAIFKWSNLFEDYIQDAKKDGIDKIWTTNCKSILEENKSLKRNIQAWIKIAEKNNIEILNKGNDLIYNEFLRGADVFVQNGGHLSDIGNQIYGEELVREILNKKLLND